MKKCKSLAALFAVTAMCVTSCSDEVPAIPASELYTRQWVKNFGAINPEQDWNAATRGTVNVTTEASARVQVTANIRGCNYLLADYRDVSGTRDLPFDIPKGVKEVTVTCGAESYRTPIGGSVSFASNGRVVPGTGSAEVTAELITDRNQWMVVPLLNATMFRSKMPEGCYNADRDGVTVDFTMKFSEHDIVVRPLYWQTNQTLSFGFFYLDDEGNPVHLPIYDMEKTADYSDNLVLSYAPAPVKTVKVTDFVNDPTFRQFMINEGIEIKTVDDVWTAGKSAEIANLTVIDNFDCRCPALEDGKMTRACRAYLESLGYENSYAADPDKRYNYVYRWKMTGDNVIDIKYPNPDYEYQYLTYKKDLEITFTYYECDVTESKAFGTANDMLGEMGGFKSVGPTPYKKFEDYDYPAMICKGIKVHIGDISKTYGAYIKNGERYMYSVSSLNSGKRWIPKPDAERTVKESDGNTGTVVRKYNASDFMIDESKRAYRAATWEGEKYNWRYMSFEDGAIPEESYSASSCDFDMQDFVFIIDNFNPDSDTPIEIIDQEKPKPIKWLIACEDLGGTDDFDFNDVVFEVEHVAGSGKATITPLAAGGTLSTYLMRNGSKVDEREWHSLFGAGPQQMVNTSSNSGPAEPFTIDVEEDFSITSPTEVYDQNNNDAYMKSMGGFYLMIEDGDGRIVTPPVLKENAEAPQMILIYQPEGNPWRWPKERIGIHSAYGDGFMRWMETNIFDASVEDGFWSATPANENYVIGR